MADSLSAAQARRVALAAQGFGMPPTGSVGTRQLNLLIRKLGLLQIDSVNVFERSHYLLPFARLGAYDRSLLDRTTFEERAPHTEYWAHVAALIPVTDRPLFEWRMRRYRNLEAKTWFEAHADVVAWVLAELADRGPSRASDLEHPDNKSTGPWWGWSAVKIALQVLWQRGEIATAGRTRFERVFALPEQVLPAHILGVAVPEADAQRQLIEQAARALGVATLADLADYYRMGRADTGRAVHALVDDGVLRPVRVEGWKDPAWLHRDARVPRRIETTALLSPFDPIVWERKRTERMFGFHYRIEIYTPEPKRQFGYYSLPVLIDDSLVGRIDLKSDRRAGVLRVQSAWIEEGHSPAAVAERVRPILNRAAQWQGLDGVEVEERGTLASWLR